MLVFYVVLAMIIVAGLVFLAKSNLLVEVNATSLAIVIIAAVLAPSGVYAATYDIAKNADQTYYEFWNGSEIKAVTSVTQCERDGSCKHEYSCDPYTVYESESYTDSEGKTKTRTVTKTKYHDCPYSTEETDFIVDTTLGKAYILADAMTGTQFRDRMEIPGGRQTAPQFWIDAKNRIEAGNPLGITKMNPYKNFIFAADATLYDNYSDKIDTLLEQNMLPLPSSSIHSYYVADKAYSVGDTGIDISSMNRQLTQLNGYVGSELHGDMHVVFADATLSGDGTDYTNALKAHWTSELAGKNAIAKNTLTLVVGVNKGEGQPTVAWANGFTGMPVGNEGLLQEFTNLKGKTIDENFIGAPKFDPKTENYSLSGGVVEGMVAGDHKFSRVSMSAADEGDNGSGFKYLDDAWEMKPAQVAIAISISSVISGLILWLGTLLSLNNLFIRDPLRNIFSKNTTH